MGTRKEDVHVDRWVWCAVCWSLVGWEGVGGGDVGGGKREKSFVSARLGFAEHVRLRNAGRFRLVLVRDGFAHGSIVIQHMRDDVSETFLLSLKGISEGVRIFADGADIEHGLASLLVGLAFRLMRTGRLAPYSPTYL